MEIFELLMEYVHYFLLFSPYDFSGFHNFHGYTLEYQQSIVHLYLRIILMDSLMQLLHVSVIIVPDALLIIFDPMSAV